MERRRQRKSPLASSHCAIKAASGSSEWRRGATNGLNRLQSITNENLTHFREREQKCNRCNECSAATGSELHNKNVLFTQFFIRSFRFKSKCTAGGRERAERRVERVKRCSSICIISSLKCTQAPRGGIIELSADARISARETSRGRALRSQRVFGKQTKSIGTQMSRNSFRIICVSIKRREEIRNENASPPLPHS